jgi:hypothetical protein
MDWRKLLPWIALLGAVVGFVADDLFLLIVALVLLVAWFFWRTPGDEASAEAPERRGR